MAIVKELFHPTLMAANTSFSLGGTDVGGFLAKTSGTISITDTNGALIIDAIPVTAGIYTPLPFQSPRFRGATVQLAGGASGVLGT